MPKASPGKYSFNAGEFSPLVEGRVDIERYPASMRRMLNFIGAQQGPCIRRSGTAMTAEAYDHSKISALLPFVFNETQALQCEFSDQIVRFILDTGVQVYTPIAVTVVVAANPLKLTIPTLAAVVGDTCIMAGFPNAMNINGRTLKITAKVGSDFTFDYNATGLALGAIAGASVSFVYAIASPYTSTDVQNIRVVQSVDVMYLFCDGYRPRKLSRYASYDWRFATMDFATGPYMPQAKRVGALKISGTGSPIGGGTASSSSGTAANAFDNDPATFWQCASNQAGWIQYQFVSPKVLNGYYIVPASVNDDTSYTKIDYAPGDFNLFGSNDGVTWFLLDSQKQFILYDTGRSPLFEVNNTIAYSYYRFEVLACTRNGPIGPRIATLGFRDAAEQVISIQLTGDYSDVAKGVGFQSTDVDRLIRVKGSDNTWRDLRIKTYTDATHITATLLDEPFINTEACLNWQLGYYSDTTGWPTCGAFFDDRLLYGGSREAPDLLVLSRTGAYDNLEQRTAADEVLDDSAVVVRLNNRRLSAIRWVSADARGVLIGTGTNEWVISASNTDNALSARNIKARSSTARGSASIEPVRIDAQTLYVQASRRTVRELAYVFESDGYKSPSMSLFASHLGVPLLAQMQYASEPHSLVWFRRDDGSVVGLTYNRDENVIGWHRHDFGGVVESISVIPSTLYVQDTLWIAVRRTINGQTKRYIERLVRFWDFDSTIADAHFVDSGLRYEGAETDTVYGLFHLEGKTVQGLVDGVPFSDLTVTNGTLVLPQSGTNILVGLQFISEAEISRIEAGAADGTAQGKTKRINRVNALCWQSARGELGKYNDESKEIEWDAMPFPEDSDELQPITLFDEMVEVTPGRGYGKRGTVSFRQQEPLPFNVISIYPQINTQDAA